MCFMKDDIITQEYEELKKKCKEKKKHRNKKKKVNNTVLTTDMCTLGSKTEAKDEILLSDEEEKDKIEMVT